jgi:hypothetical protein
MPKHWRAWRSSSNETQAEAIKLICISQNFNDRRARAAHSDWQSLARYGFCLPVSFSPGSCTRAEGFPVTLAINKDGP